jgi:hypothetical protein
MTKHTLGKPQSDGHGQNQFGELLPANVAAIWGAFLYEGMMTSHQNPERGDQVLRMWSSGCIELLTETCGYLDKVWEYSRERWHQVELFEGVFEYEVISPLGSLLGYYVLLNDGKLPSRNISNGMIEDLVDNFFIQGNRSLRLAANRTN